MLGSRSGGPGNPGSQPGETWSSHGSAVAIVTAMAAWSDFEDRGGQSERHLAEFEFRGDSVTARGWK